MYLTGREMQKADFHTMSHIHVGTLCRRNACTNAITKFLM